MTHGPPGRPVRTVFLGSGDFGRPAFRRLAAHPSVHLVGVVTAPARPVGRKQALTRTPIAALAAELGIEQILMPTRLRVPGSVDQVLALDPSLLVLADYGQIVPAALLGLPHGALNLHPSLLPRHRGAIPVPAAILAGDTETGVTLMRMDAGLDTGPIVAQSRRPVPMDATAPELQAALEEDAAALLDENLDAWIAGELLAVPQAVEGTTLTRPLRREDGRLDPAQPAAALERQVRAYQPWPGSFVELDGERIVVALASVAASAADDLPGAFVTDGVHPALATTDGRLVLEGVTPAGRRPMSGAEWLRGRRVSESPQ